MYQSYQSWYDYKYLNRCHHHATSENLAKTTMSKKMLTLWVVPSAFYPSPLHGKLKMFPWLKFSSAMPFCVKSLSHYMLWSTAWRSKGLLLENTCMLQCEEYEKISFSPVLLVMVMGSFQNVPFMSIFPHERWKQNVSRFTSLFFLSFFWGGRGGSLCFCFSSSSFLLDFV